jgi:hypothetical protein
MRQLKSIFRSGRSVLYAGLLVALPAFIVGLEHAAQAARVADGQTPQLLIRLDDDHQAHHLIQGGAAANQSHNRTDVLDGGSANVVAEPPSHACGR